MGFYYWCVRWGKCYGVYKWSSEWNSISRYGEYIIGFGGFFARGWMESGNRMVLGWHRRRPRLQPRTVGGGGGTALQTGRGDYRRLPHPISHLRPRRVLD